MAKQNLAPLVIKIQAGDEAAWNDLMSACYETLYYYAYNTVKDHDLAGDITQESCMEIMQTIGNLRNPEAFLCWAGRIVAHQCTRYYRQTKDEVYLEENEDGETILDRLPDESRGSLPEQVQEDKEFKQIMWEMLDSLPEEQRQALALYYLENMSVGEIAEIQGRSAGTVKSRLNYGRKAVIAKVDAYEKKTGVRLHSIAPLPLLLYFLFRENMAEVLESASGTLQNVWSTISGGMGGTSAGTAGAAGTAAAAGTGIAAKIAAGVVAVAVALGAVAGGIGLIQKGGDDDGKSSGQNGGQKDDPAAHVHQFSAGYNIDETSHQALCVCGETAGAEPHTYEERLCTVCGSRKPSEGLEYTVKDNTYCVITGIGTCTDADVVIPSHYEGLPVRIIAQNAFRDCKSITSVFIPETVTHIEQWAFMACSNMTNVYFSEGLQRIDDLVFIWCTSLEEVVFPDSLSQMGHSIFNECISLQYVELSEGLTELQRGVFSNCDSLTTVVIPASITQIGNKAFWHCTSLSDIIYGGSGQQWKEITKMFECTSAGDVTTWCSDTGEFTVHCTDGDLTKTEAREGT